MYNGEDLFLTGGTKDEFHSVLERYPDLSFISFLYEYDATGL